MAVVRGERAVSSLKSAGLHVRSTPDFIVRPELPDIAAGVLRYAVKPRGANRWADLLLHAAYIEIEPLPGSPDWDSLMGAIWDAVSGCPIQPAALVAARAAIVVKAPA